MFIKRLFHIFGFIALLLLNNAVMAMPAACESATIKTETLWAGQHIDAGTVSVMNDATYLYVRYELTDPAGTIDATHLWIGDLTQLAEVTKTGNRPHAGKNRKIAAWYGQTILSGAMHDADTNWWDAGGEVIDSGTYYVEYRITLADLGIDTQTFCPDSAADAPHLYIVPHAALGGGTGTDKDGNPTSLGGQTAYGGSEPGNNDKGSWWYYIDYQMQCPCADTGGPVGQACETAFAKGNEAKKLLDGGDHRILAKIMTVGSKRRPVVLNNPENLDTANAVSARWGWEILFNGVDQVYTLYAGAGLNDTANGQNVGTATVTRSADGSLTVTYMTDSGLWLEDVHVNVSSEGLVADEATAGMVTVVAPGLFTYVNDLEMGDQNTYSVTLDPADIDTWDGRLPVWITIHTSVCGF